MSPHGAPQGAISNAAPCKLAQQGAISAPVSPVLAPAKLALTPTNNTGFLSVKPSETNLAQLSQRGAGQNQH